MARVATLEVVITAVISKFTSGLNDAQGKLSGFNKGLASVAKGLTGFDLSTLGAAAAVGALGAGLKYALGQAVEREAEFAQLEAVIKSTGGAAGLTAEQVSNMADSFSQTTSFADDVILSGQNLLLTFTNIGADVFPMATQAMLDMSVAMGTSADATGGAESGAIQLGKALNDPINGISALTRVGVTFSKEQKEMIKTMVEMGDVAGAQKIIIAELNKEFGGSAAARLDTYAGKMEQLKNNMDNLAETVGNVLLPPLAEAAGALSLLMTWNDKVDAAMVEHEAHMRATAASYEEYATEMTRVNAAAGEFAPISTHNDWAMGENVQTLGMLTEAQFKSARGLDALAKSWEAARLRMEGFTSNAKAAADAIDHSTGKAAVGMTNIGRAAGGMRDSLTFAYDAGMLLAMGLDGALGQAMEDYQGVMEETTPEIERLTAEIAEYQRTQGQTVTVTEVATTSLHEYELGTLKAAEAAAELADYVDGDALELAQLQVNADKAQASVNELGEGLGISRDYTIDHTKALAEDNAALAELIGKQEAAEAAIRKATAEMVLQQVAANLGADMALEYAHATGILSDADYELSKSIQRATDAADINRNGEIDSAREREILLDATLRLTDQTIGLALGTETATSNMSSATEATTPLVGGLDAVSMAAEHVTSAIDMIPPSVAVDTTPAMSSLDNATTSAYNFHRELDNIPRNVTVDVITNNHTNYSGYQIPGAAAGADFIVPPGFPHDSYPMRVQSGERVQVTPAGAPKTGGSGVTINQVINNFVAPVSGASLLQTARAVAGAW